MNCTYVCKQVDVEYCILWENKRRRTKQQKKYIKQQQATQASIYRINLHNCFCIYYYCLLYLTYTAVLRGKIATFF